MFKKTVTIAAICLVSSYLTVQRGQATEPVKVVGSSTLYPFIETVANEFGKYTSFATPSVLSNGTLRGIDLFCEGVGLSYPDMVNASRPMTKNETKKCTQNGVTDIIKLPVGLDGIVLVNSVYADIIDISRRELYLALAKKVPINGKLVLNPYKQWQDINPKLADTPILIYGPPKTSGTRETLVEKIMEYGCNSSQKYKMSSAKEGPEDSTCKDFRDDGLFIETSENDSETIQKLHHDQKAFALVGFTYLEQNGEKVQGQFIDGVEPNFSFIADKTYPLTRDLYIYVKKEHLIKKKGLYEFVSEIMSDKATGEEGYLTYKGLVTYSNSKRKEQLRTLRKQLR